MSDQVNYRKVNGQVAHPCPFCGSDMDSDKAWWWTWHGACCSETCAIGLIEMVHGSLTPCVDGCKP